MHHAKKAGKVSFIVGLGVLALPVLIGLWASRHAHRKIKHPILKPAVIVAIMIPSLFAGRAWAATVTGMNSTTTEQHSFASDNSDSKIEKKLITETQTVPFEEQTVNDASLPKGQSVVRQEGKPGVKTVTFQITLKDGQETSRTQVNEALNTPPDPKITAVGTKTSLTSTPKATPKPATPLSATSAPTPVPTPVPTVQALNNRCSPHYTPCVPIASDVDCAGGTGDGPLYVSGPIKVIGRDVYGLDSDHDGWGCEN